MLTTTQLRSLWGPGCTPPGQLATVTLHGGGRVTVRASIIDAVRALDGCLRAADYRTRVGDTGAFNCRPITGGTGLSLHAFGIALDLNWSTNPYGPRLVTDMPPAMVAAIKAIRTNSGAQVWGWGGDYRGNRDAMHYEVVCRPADIASGIYAATSPGPTPPTPIRPPFTAPPAPQGDDDMVLVDNQSGEVWSVSATHMHHLTPAQWEKRSTVEKVQPFPVPPLYLLALAASRVVV